MTTAQKKIPKKRKSTATSTPSPFCARIGGSASRESSWSYPVCNLFSAIVYFLISHPPEEAMMTNYKATFVSLHVRKSNKPAIALYRDSLGFRVAKVEPKYCTFLLLY